MTTIEQGCIDIWIDKIVPCLEDTVTGDIKETVVFMENQVLTPDYYEQPNPYVNAPSCHVNLLELSKYGKKLTELTQEEVKKFSIKKIIKRKSLY